MKKRSLILFLMLLAVANLVFAADWHERVTGDESALEYLANAEGKLGTDRGNHSHPPGGSCVHSHSCHAHSHLFFVETSGYGPDLPSAPRWRAEDLPLPPQHFLAPDVPPPIA
ncbi:hypothetical protein [Gilvimarinus chinensis]|uniref:hypothetical protein n=1 Tax=Gilvimarinus chinensis TaxID=396005 RepID=UPI00036733C6|nr:hypothetical protein [Gilvimarinus chinensis]